MEPIRLPRDPRSYFSSEPTTDWQIDPAEQRKRDEIRLDILRGELQDFEARGDRVSADAVRREISRTTNGLATAPVRDSVPNPGYGSGAPAKAPADGPIRLERNPRDYFTPSGQPRRDTGAYHIDYDAAPAQEDRGFFRGLKDVGVKVLGGVPKAAGDLIGVGSMVPGLNEYTEPIAKTLNEMGNAIDQAWLSSYQLGKEKEFSDLMAQHDNFTDQFSTALEWLAKNPSQGVMMGAQSLPGWIAGGKAGKALRLGGEAMGLTVTPRVAGALGEGTLSAGSTTNQLAAAGVPVEDRWKTAIPAGLGTAGLSYLGGRIMGESDIDTALASGRSVDLLKPLTGTTAGRVARNIVGEGVVEELPQSLWEQAMTNVGTGRPITENLGSAGATGLMVGGLMGGGFGLRRPGNTYTQAEAKAALQIMQNPEAPADARLRAADFVRRIETGELGEEQANTRFNEYIGNLFTQEQGDTGTDTTQQAQTGPLGTPPSAATGTAQPGVPASQTAPLGATDTGVGETTPTGATGAASPDAAQAGAGAFSSQTTPTPTGWEAQWQLAQIAADNNVDLSKMNRDEYANFAIQHGMQIDDTQLRMRPDLRTATSMQEYMARVQQDRANTPVRQAADKQYANWVNKMLDLALQRGNKTATGALVPGVTVRSGSASSNSWVYFKINNGAGAASNTTHKAYVGFSDVYQSMTPARMQDFMKALQAAGYQGDIKFIQDLPLQSRISDQIVMHGATQQDAVLGQQVAQKFFGNEANFHELGVDIGNKSHSQVYADRIKKEVAANKAKAAKKATKKPAAKKTAPKKPTKPKTEAKTEAKTEDKLGTALAEDIEVADEAADRALASKTANDVNKEDLGAEVQGDKSIKFAGRMSTWLSSNMLSGIRNALLKKDGKVSKAVGPRGQKIVTAARAFANAYNEYMNVATEIVRTNKVLAREDATSDTAAKLQAKIDALTEQLPALANKVSNALHAFGQSVDNNAKNVEAIVRFVKDSVQKKLVKPGRSDKKIVDAMRSIDAMLSSAWNSAKRGTFMGEQVDLADISGAEARQSTEQQAAGKTVSALEDAYNNGYKSPKGGKDPYKGLAGVLQYLSFHTTPHGKVLAIALQESMDQSGNAPKVVFSDTESSRYDPKTNTIYIKRGEQSAEVVLHETFHAALQWFVYQNPKHPAVKSLQESLQRVLAIEGLTGKALDVQNILRDLVGQKRGLDAVLELVSYNATLNEFRKAMQQVPSSGKTLAFRMSLSNIWNNIKRLVTQAFGLKPSLASDIMDASMQLLEESGKGDMPKKFKGNTLYAQAQSNPTGPSAVPGMTNLDFATYRNNTSWFKLPTNYAFELLGFGKDAMGNDRRATAYIKAKLTELAEKIREAFPATEVFLGMMDSQFSVPGSIRNIMAAYKVTSQTPLAEMERLVNFVRASDKATIQSVMDYMDGNTRALDGLADNRKTARIANDLKKLFDRAIANLPEKERALFEGRKFSEYLIYPDTPEGLAGVGLGMRNLGRVLGMRTETEPNIDAFIDAGWIDGQYGVKTLDNLYKVTQELSDGTVIKAGYISKSIYEKTGAPSGFAVDTSALWKMTTPKEGNYRFTTSINTKQAIELGDKERLGNAMMNTAAALLHRDASRNMLAQLAAYGREEGLATANTVAFNDVAEINRVFTKRSIAESDVLDAGSRMAASPMVRNAYRRTGTWVRMPSGADDKATYGALAGKIIPGPVWNSLMDMHDRSPLFNFQSLNNVMQFYKDMKTTKNPATHVTNIASNIVLSYMHDIPFSAIKNAARLYALYETAPNQLNDTDMDMVQSFMNSGAMLGSYTTAEAKQALHQAFIKATSPDSDSSTLTRLKSFAKYQEAKSLLTKIDGMSKEVYAAEDNIFRLAAYMNVAGNIQFRDGTKGLSEEQRLEAGMAARKLFLDYDIDSPLVRAARQSALPFVSWTYAALPLMGRMAIEKPWAFANVTLALMLLTAAMGGADDEEKRKIDKKFGERAFGGWGPYMHVRIPFLGDDASPVYINLGKYIPFFSVFQPPQGNAKVAGMDWIPGFLAPSGPFANLYAAIGLGVDPFTGKSIHEPTDTDLQKLGNVANAVADIMLPPAASKRNRDKWGAILDDKKTLLGKDPDTLFIARSLGGLSLYQYDEQEARTQQSKDIKRLQKDYKAAMKKARMNEYLKGYPDYEAVDEDLADLRERLNESVSERLGIDEEE